MTSSTQKVEKASLVLSSIVTVSCLIAYFMNTRNGMGTFIFSSIVSTALLIVAMFKQRDNYMLSIRLRVIANQFYIFSYFYLMLQTFTLTSNVITYGGHVELVIFLLIFALIGSAASICLMVCLFMTLVNKETNNVSKWLRISLLAIVFASVILFEGQFAWFLIVGFTSGASSIIEASLIMIMKMSMMVSILLLTIYNLNSLHRSY